MAINLDLVAAVRDGLAGLANPAKAPDMQSYMKSAMPFLGVQKPARTALFREVFGAYPLDPVAWEATVLALWREAAYREERYAAIDLTGWRGYRSLQTPAVLPLYEELIVTGAWWDFVDEVAIRRVGPILRAYRAELTPVMLAWARDDDPWKRRTSVICQVTAKGETDLALLYACIEANVGDRDFFLRKAIGWALRDYAWHDPAEVRRYVEAHPELSPLSRREALKNV